jgi:hypothetical protein
MTDLTVGKCCNEAESGAKFNESQSLSPVPRTMSIAEAGVSSSDDGSDTDMSNSGSESGDSTQASQCGDKHVPFRTANAFAAATTEVVSSTGNDDAEDKIKKEMIRKERKREAVRRCRKRKREAAIQLEEQVQYQRQRQDDLVRKVKKKSLLGIVDNMLLSPRPPNSLIDVAQSRFEYLSHLNNFQPDVAHRLEYLPHRHNLLALQQGLRGLGACPAALDQQLHQELLFIKQHLLARHHADRRHQEDNMLRSYLLKAASQPFTSMADSAILAKLQQPQGYHQHLNASKWVGAAAISEDLMKAQHSLGMQQQCHASAGVLPRGNTMNSPLMTLLAVAEADQQIQSSLKAPPPPKPTSVATATASLLARSTSTHTKPSTKRARTTTPANLTEDEKEARRKERKREAVRRCRLKKRQEQELLAQETQKLLQLNAKLQHRLHNCSSLFLC